MSRRWASCAAMLVLSLWACVAVAAHGRWVVILRSEGAPKGPTMALVEAELRAGGFEVRTSEVPGTVDVAALDQATADSETMAALATRQTEEGLVATVVLTDRESAQRVPHEVSVGFVGEEGARVLALRVTELLHANSLELAPREPVPAPPPPEPVESPPPAVSPAPAAVPGADREARDAPSPPSSSSRAPTWGVAVGPTLLGGPGGLPVGVAPSALVSMRLHQRWAVELGVIAPAFGTLEEAGAQADLDQEMVVFRARASTRWAALEPHVHFGVGAHRLGATGQADAPLRGTSQSRVGFAAALGVGARLSLAKHLGLLGEVSGAVVLPRPAIRFAGRTVGSVAAPMVLGTLALEVLF